MKKDWRERELTIEVIVGAFLVMIFFGLGYFTIVLSKEALFQKTYEMKVTFEDVGGLREGDNVYLRGMPVGKVRGLELKCQQACMEVCVTVRLDMPIDLHEGYSFRIVPSSLLGGQQLQIHEGDLGGDVVEMETYVGDTPRDLIGDAAQIVAAAREEIIEGDVFGRVRNIVVQLEEVATRVNAGEGTLGQLLAEDDTVYADMAAAVASVRRLVEGLEDGQGLAGALLAGDSSTASDLDAVISSLRNIVEKVERGEGTVGRLLADERVYEDIEATVSEVRAAVDDFRETAPVTTFSSIFFGAF